MQSKEDAFKRLDQSPFRSRFHLSAKDRAYIQEKGVETIRSHAETFIRERLAPGKIDNDGKQTPMKGHPVFIAQHATACCCRGCLEKWYGVKQNRALTDDQIERIVNFLMAWIERDLAKPLGEKKPRGKASSRPQEPKLF